jgi:hypothetical protein
MFSAPRHRHTPVVLVAALAMAGCNKSAPPPAALPAPSPAPAATTPAPKTAMVDSAPLLRSAHASFSGNLPCPDCKGIAAKLTLQRDQLGRNSYVLNETYQRDAPSSSVVQTGSWRLEADRTGDPPLAVLYLDSGRPGDVKVFDVDDKGGLGLLSLGNTPLPAGASYTLKHDGGDLDLGALFAAMLPASMGTGTSTQ